MSKKTDLNGYGFSFCDGDCKNCPHCAGGENPLIKDFTEEKPLNSLNGITILNDYKKMSAYSGDSEEKAGNGVLIDALREGSGSLIRGYGESKLSRYQTGGSESKAENMSSFHLDGIVFDERKKIISDSRKKTLPDCLSGDENKENLLDKYEINDNFDIKINEFESKADKKFDGASENFTFKEKSFSNKAKNKERALDRLDKKRAALIILAMVLCVMLTILSCSFLSGEGFSGLITWGREKDYYYLLSSGRYSTVPLAREAAEIIRARGGAGYVLRDGDDYHLIVAAFPTREEAEAVLKKQESGFYIIEIPYEKETYFDLDEKETALKGLEFFDESFKKLNELTIAIEKGDIALSSIKPDILLMQGKAERYYRELKGDDERIAALGASLAIAAAQLDNTIKLLDNGSIDISDIRKCVVAMAVLRHNAVPLRNN